jgi:CHASE2 domain-containing sensor protein
MPARSPLFTRRKYLLGVFVVLLAILDPFGLSSSSSNASAQWLNRIFANFYPDEGQQQIAVILIDDAYLSSNNTHWPMPYDEQSKLFKSLLAYKPKAVFVDLMYSYDHSSDDQPQSSQLLVNVFDRYQRQGIGLSLANTGQIRGKDGQANTLASLAAVGSPALVAWSGFDDKYPLAVETPLGFMETPALLLYRQYCQGHSCTDLPVDGRAATQVPPMAIQWGLKEAPGQKRISNISDCSTPNGWFLETAKQLMHAIFWKLGDTVQPHCAYNLTLSASALNVSTPEDRALLAELLNNRLVLVGANITSTGDLVQSPVHGKIPGIYLHAMALDNLINQGMHYSREPDNLWSLGVNWLDLVQIALLGLIALLKAVHERRREESNSGWARKSRFFHSPIPYWLLMMSVLALLSYVLHCLHITPVNVLAVLLISLVLFSEKVDAVLGRKH